MKITVDLPEDLVIAINAKTAAEGREFNEVLAGPPASARLTTSSQISFFHLRRSAFICG